MMSVKRSLFCLVIVILTVNLCCCVKNKTLTEKEERDVVKFLRHEINKCDIHDEPTLSQCLKDVALLLRPYMVYGIKNWDVPVLEPLFLKSVKIALKEGGSNLKARFENVYIYGLSSYEIVYLKTFPSEYRYKLGMHFPRLKIIGNYNMEGKILLMELKDHGPFSANLTNVKVDMDSKLKAKNGLLNLYEVNTELDIGNIKFHLDNLLRGTQIEFMKEQNNTECVIERIISSEPMPKRKRGSDLSQRMMNHLAAKEHMDLKTYLSGESVNAALNADVDELMKELKPAFAEQINKITVRTLLRGMQNLPLEKWQAAIR